METRLWFVIMTKKEIYFLSTIHKMKEERIPKRGCNEIPSTKLSLISDYNKYMGGVDRNNAFIGNYTCVPKTFKRTVKVVMHLIEEAVLNAFILYDKTYPNKMPFMNFKMEVIESTITRARLTNDDTFEHPTREAQKKKASINVKIVLIIRVCGPHHVLRHTTNEK